MSTRCDYSFSQVKVSKEELRKRDVNIFDDVKKAWTALTAFPTCKGWERVVYTTVIRNSNYLMMPIMRYRSGEKERWVFNFSKGMIIYVRKDSKNKWAEISFSHSVGRWVRYRILQGLLLRSRATNKYAKKCTKVDHCMELSDLYAKSKELKMSMNAMMAKNGNKFENSVKSRRSRKRRLQLWDDQYLKEQKKRSSN